ncbi:GNAT family N-acetyltransferase [Ureibacillus sp. GCM10028918]|uniref:GNAT family N-acetyltransferase n=1 Tax=Ureibacillus sp. GCM10028918 TaxID=3273429 RepID=UPI0036071C5A
MYIESDRLLIRKFNIDDVKEVHEYTSNPFVMKYIPEGVLSMVETHSFIIENMGEVAEKFAVILKEENRLIGHIAFFKYFGNHTYEIGWVFNSNYYNRGFATEAAHTILNYGFSELKLHRIIATCQPENIPSYRIMKKIGMRREGLFKKCIPHNDEWWDEYFYAILGEEWTN